MPIVMITGSSRGLGWELANKFSDGGYEVILHSRGSVYPMGMVFGGVVVGDLSEASTIEALAIVAHDRKIDILINNAGEYLSGNIDELSYDATAKIVGVNLLAPILLTMAVWPVLKRSQLGMVINISSLAGQGGGPGESVYSATKAGLSAFSNTLQFDATRDGIRVIDVLLGSMVTDMTEGRLSREKFVDPAEAADVIFNLCKEFKTLRATTIEIKRRIY